MAQPLTLRKAWRGRLRDLAITTIVAAVFLWFIGRYDASLRRAAFFDGWILFSCVLFLAAFNVRKKLPMLPLGRAAAWTWLHIYVGLFAVVAFLSHSSFALPDGALDWALWLAFVLVSVSGLVGLYLSRVVPPKLGQAQERVLFERIPGFRIQLAREALELAKQSVREEASLTISNLYADTLHDFMRAPRNLIAHLSGSRRPVLRLCADFDRLEAFLDQKGRDLLDQIRQRVIAKDSLDFQYAHLGLLRLWLFVHIPAAYGLILLGLAHAAIGYAFSSGSP